MPPEHFVAGVGAFVAEGEVVAFVGHVPVKAVLKDGVVEVAHHECGQPRPKRSKRLIDFGFHAPTLAFPVAGTLMVEPTESEDLQEIERFVQAMMSIRAEIDAVIAGEFSLEDSPLRNAPHPAVVVAANDWSLPYTREQAAFPVGQLRNNKYFPPVSRVEGAYGDRNLVCACPPPEAFSV